MRNTFWRFMDGGSPAASLSAYSAFRKVLPELALASLVINLLGLALPLMLLQVYDRIIPRASGATLALLTGGVLVALGLEVAARIGRSYITGWLGASFDHRVNCAAFDHLMRAPLNEYEREGHTSHLEKLHAISRVRDFYSGQALLSLFDLPFAIVYFVIIGMLGGWLVMVPLALAAVFVTMAVRNGLRSRSDISKRMQLDERRFSFIAETLGGIHAVKSMAMESLMQRRYEMLQATNVEHAYQTAVDTMAATNFGALFTQLSTVGVVATGAAVVVHGEMTPGALAACIMLAGRSVQPLHAVLGTWMRLQNFIVARQQVDKVFAMAPKSERQPDLPPIVGAIRVENATIRYDRADKPLFNDLWLSVEPGECIAVIGDSGSGKSSLLQLIAGILKPSVGQVFIDDLDVARYRPSSVARQIAYLPQQGVVLDGTILENITMFDETKNQAALAMARELGLDRVVAGMRHGYDTHIGSSTGDALPAGIRQRIAIARELLNDPAIIIFDEANIALDIAADDALRLYLESVKGKRTMVLVTHRPSLLKLADRTVIIENGRLVDQVERGRDGQQQAAAPLPLPAERPAADSRLSMIVVERFPVVSDLLVCLPVLLKALRWQGTPREIGEALPHLMPPPPGGTPNPAAMASQALDLSGFRRVMGNLGFMCRSVAVALDKLDPRLLPCVFVPRDGDAKVLLRFEPGMGFYAFDSGQVATEYLVPDATHGEASIFRPVEPAPKGGEAGSWLGKVILRFHHLLWLMLLLTLVVNVMGLSTPLFVTAVYNSVLPSGDVALIPYLLIGLALVWAGDWSLRRVRADLLAFVGARSEYIVGSAIFRRILELPVELTERVTVGGQVARIKDFESLRDTFTGPVAPLLYELPGIIVFIITLGVIHPMLLVVMLGSMVGFTVLGLVSAPGMAEKRAAATRAGANRHEFLADALEKMRAVRSAGAEERWYHRMRVLSGKAVAAEFAAQQHSARVAAAAQMVGTLTGVASLVTCVIGAVNQTVSIGVVVAAMIITWRLVSPLQNGFLSLGTLYRATTSVRQVDNLMRLRVEKDVRQRQNVAPAFRGEVNFSRASFRYSSDADPAIIGVNLTIEPGRVAGIAGGNGAGKSTLLKMIAGLYHPQAGSVRIDSIDIRQMDPGDLRAAISYAPQRCDIFYGTIAQNLRLVYPSANDDELRWATEMAGLYGDILRLPQGFDTRITGSGGDHLPNGFKQRLSLARAYLKPAPIILFDEPGNGLDNDGERAFLAAIERLRGKSTVIMVSHRPSHLRLADAVIYMENGYVVDVGTFDKLGGRIMGTQR